MPVTFGTIQLVPASASPAPTSASGSPGAAQPRSTAGDARELAPVLQHLHDRNARVRAH